MPSIATPREAKRQTHHPADRRGNARISAVFLLPIRIAVPEWSSNISLAWSRFTMPRCSSRMLKWNFFDRRAALGRLLSILPDDTTTSAGLGCWRPSAEVRASHKSSHLAHVPQHASGIAKLHHDPALLRMRSRENLGHTAIAVKQIEAI